MENSDVNRATRSVKQLGWLWQEITIVMEDRDSKIGNESDGEIVGKCGLKPVMDADKIVPTVHGE